RHSTFRPLMSLLVALAMLGVVAPAATLAADEVGGVAGDPTLTLDVGDSAAGGEVILTFERAYANVTVDGTPVYVYVPEGSIGNEDVLGMSPAIDPNPADEFTPCPEKFDAGDYLITQAQVTALGDELTNQIVRVDEEHYGFVGSAGDSGDAIVLLAYNVFDDFFYDCAADTYTAGFFAPNFIADYGMNVIVTDTFDWANRVGGADPVYEGVIAHELEHLLMNYSDPGELSWVDEGLADMAIFFNGWGDTNDSHILYHQVFHRETSLTRWGGGLENYGASYTYFLYLWEQAGGNGGGDLTADLTYSGTSGDRLIKLIFENAADGMAGVQGAIDTYNATLQPGETALESAEDFFKDWAVAIWLDAEVNGTKFDFANIDFGDAITRGWTIEIANELFFGDRGIYNGSMPPARWAHNKNVPGQTALPFGVSYETFRNPGPTFSFVMDGEDSTQVKPYTGDTHWYAGYQSQFDSILNVDAPAITGGETVNFWTWYFIEEGWDYGFVEALVGTDWVTVPLTDATTGAEVTTNDDPQGNNTEGNGLTGTSGGAYFVDEPAYINLEATLPAGATDVRFRYSTDAAYLDTGWFVDDVTVDGTAATLSSEPGNWVESTGEQDNNWVIQIISPCDLTPGVDSFGEIVDTAGFVYRFEGDLIEEAGFSTKCLGGQGRIAVVISNLPTGDLTFLDADYSFQLTNTGNKKK
ncbi:MAG: hypothetical protein ABI622_07005, partial [Chloroflexota bacterium]